MTISPQYLFELLVDNRNRALYQDVSARIQLSLTPSNDSTWCEKTKDGHATIYYAPSSYPIACITHELLHIRANLNGLSSPGYKVIGSPETHQLTQDLVPYAYNQLIHHHFFDEFIGMGFNACEFLDESDRTEAEAALRKDLAKFKRLKKQYRYDLPLKILIMPYLCAKSPHDESESMQQVTRQLRNLSGGSTYRIDKLLAELRNDITPDMQSYMARLFNCCGLVNVGFGRSEDNLVWSESATMP